MAYDQKLADAESAMKRLQDKLAKYEAAGGEHQEETMSASVALELSGNTQLRCIQCGCQNFRICMECNEDTDEISDAVANNVECSTCHALYQVNLVRPSAPPMSDPTNLPGLVQGAMNPNFPGSVAPDMEEE